MKKIIKIATAALLMLFVGYVISVDVRASNEKTQDTTKSKMLINLKLSNDFKPIKKGEKVVITVLFDTARVKRINIPDVGTATKKQLKEGKCSFTVKPKKTTKYILEYNAKFSENLPFMDDTYSFEIVVVDENGKKIE